MSKKDNWSEQKFVYSETDLKDAMQEEFGRIIVRGEIASKILKNIDRNPKLRKISNWSIVIGIWLWPLLLAGIAGRILTATDFRYYTIERSSENELVLKRKGID